MVRHRGQSMAWMGWLDWLGSVWCQRRRSLLSLVVLSRVGGRRSIFGGWATIDRRLLAENI